MGAHQLARDGQAQATAGAVLDRQAFEDCLQTYYAMMGWDGDGRPTRATLYDYGLEWVLERQ